MPAYVKLADLNKFLGDKVGVEQISGWKNWRLESAVPLEDQLSASDSAACRLQWLNTVTVVEPLLVWVKDNVGGQRHVVAVANYRGQKAIFDSFEKVAMKYGPAALAVCSGGDEVVGIGEVYRLVSRVKAKKNLVVDTDSESDGDGEGALVASVAALAEAPEAGPSGAPAKRRRGLSGSARRKAKKAKKVQDADTNPADKSE